VEKIKLVVFDMDNVLYDTGYFETHKHVSASTWELVWKHLKAESENKRLKEKWASGGYGHVYDWQAEAAEAFRKLGLKKSDFARIVRELPFMPGAKETLAELKRRGIKTAIISGGFYDMAVRAKLDLGIDYLMATCYFIFEGEDMQGCAILPFDYEGKAMIFNALISSLKIKPSECAFVGDGPNDVQIAKEVGLSIAFNAREELRSVSKVCIDKKDLREILRYI
jgi:phosphoserine phosphatase